jgi:hypothetical protein
VFEDRDLYQSFYTDYLWRLLPEVYRASDSDDPAKSGPLRELVERLGAQISVVRRSIDRTMEDQSIESCDDWVIPYIGDLLATNIVAGLDARAQRLDVAKTIYYRRRKGTVAILEEIAADITGWNARVVEFFRHLARTRHNFDPEIGLDVPRGVIEGLRGTLSGTSAGGFADLRHAGAAQKTNTAFDEYFYTADFRKGRSGSGWHNIPKLGVFLWRLRSYRYPFTTPVQDAVCPGQFTFDPTGREIPLFARDFRDPSQYGDAWVTPDEWMLPGRISAELYGREKAHLYPDSLAVFDVSVAGATLVPASSLQIHLERGRYQEAAPPAPGAARRVEYHNGFSSEVGAGAYDRRALLQKDLPTPAPVAPTVTDGGAQLQAAITALGATGTVPVGDSLTYTSIATPWNVTDALVQGGLNQRPVVRLNGGQWVIQGGGGNAKLSLESILFSGADIVLRGTFETVTISCSTVDPGEEIHPDGTTPQTVDGRPLRPSTIWVEGMVANLVLRRAICGPIRTRSDGVVEKIVATDSIIQSVRTDLPGALNAAAIFDPRRLARRLKSGIDPVAMFLRTSFSAPAAADLGAYNPASAPSNALLATIVTEINTILATGSLYSPARFSGIPLPPPLVVAALAVPMGPALLRVNRLLLEAAFPLELQPAAMATLSGEAVLERSSVLGSLYGHRISASESILHGFAVAEDPQAGCVRFSAYVEGSRLHQPYESVVVRENSGVFITRRFGQPEYAQLVQLADREIISGLPGATISAGAKDGSEMGAFSLEKNPIKERGLRIKFGEYMPIGLTPVLIFVT